MWTVWAAKERTHLHKSEEINMKAIASSYTHVILWATREREREREWYRAREIIVSDEKHTGDDWEQACVSGPIKVHVP